MDSSAEYVPSPWEVSLYPADTAAWAAVVAPGAAAVSALALVDPEALAQPGRVDALVAVERQLGWLQARQVRIVAAMGDDPMRDAVVPDLEREWVKEDIRAGVGDSAVAAQDRLTLARDLVHRLPDTLAALEAGRITLRHARHLADALAGLDDTSAHTVQAVALEFAASRRDLASFRRKVAREVAKADPRSMEEQFADRLAERHVSVSVDSPGMSAVSALLPAEGADALLAAIDLRADLRAAAGPGDPRSRDQRRADALVQLGLDALNGTCPRCGDTGASDHGAGVGSGRLRPAVQVTVALSTLLCLDEQPGELDRHGPIPASLARRLAGDQSGTWRRLVTDDAGRLVDYGRTVYRPPTGLARHVEARDRTCRFPGCNRTACTCELDHVVAWADGGPTNEANLAVLCCRHHHGKHDAGWSLKRLSDGSIEWTSPTGHTYLVPAATYPIDTTADAINTPDGEHPATDADPDPPSEDQPPF